MLSAYLNETAVNEADAFEVGTFALAETPRLALAVAERVARARGKLDFEAFRSVFADKPEKPARPTDDAIESQVSAKGYRGEKALVYRVYLENKTREAYHLALTEYEQKEATRARFLVLYTPDTIGYLAYISEGDNALSESFSDRFYTLAISERDRERHTYITGGSGSGKTEAVKAIIFNYIVRNTGTAVVIIDPHGDLAEQVAKWPEPAQSGRLVYIDPFLSKGSHSPVFNPLELRPGDRTPEGIDNAVQELMGVFREIIAGDFSAQMETLLKPCLATLLLFDGSTLTDIIDFMDDEKNKGYLSFADEHLYNPTQRAFLKNDFGRDAYRVTRQSLRTKIQSLLNTYAFYNFAVGKSTFDLEELIEKKSIIVFNLSKGRIGDFASSIIGRFIIAKLQFLALSRQDTPEHLRIPCHVFVDECQMFITDSIEKILTEARKYRFYLTLAQQILGHNMTTGLRDLVLGNTGVKLTGYNAEKTLAIIAKETATDLDELKALKTGHFHVWTRGRPSIRTRMPKNRLQSKGAMSDEAWERVQVEQLARYYRAIRPAPLVHDSDDGADRSAERRQAHYRTRPKTPLPID